MEAATKSCEECVNWRRMWQTANLDPDEIGGVMLSGIIWIQQEFRIRIL